MPSKKQVINQLNTFYKFTQLDETYIDESWKANLKQLIKKYIDEKSHFLDALDNIKLITITADENTWDEYEKNNVFFKVNLKLILDEVIKYVKLNGIKNQGNFISRMSEGWAIFLFSLISLAWSGFCYGMGGYLTQNKIDREKIEMKNKIDSLFRVTKSLKTDRTLRK